MSNNFYRYPWSLDDMNNYFYRSSYPTTISNSYSNNRYGGFLWPFVGGLLVGGLFAPTKTGNGFFNQQQPAPYYQPYPVYYQPYPYPYQQATIPYYQPSYVTSQTPIGTMYQTTSNQL